MTRAEAKKTARNVSDSRAFQALARLGYAVNGLLHLLIGGIAITVAIGGSGEQADQSGALSGLSSSPGGVLVLWVVVVGLVALGIWQVVAAFLVPAADPKRKWAHRAAELGKAVAYLAVAATAYTFASGGSTSSAGDTQSFSAALLQAPGGPILLSLVGAGILAIGAYFCVKGVTKKFKEDVSVPAGTLGTVIVAVGIAGYAAKGVALAVVGVLFAVAAFTIDPSKATGLDGALKSLVALPFGVVILSVVGTGLVAYGLYCFARAKYARL